MQLIRSFNAPHTIDTPVIFTFGVFDGVHLGHQYIFKKVQERAKEEKTASCCLTFSNHPHTFFSPEKPFRELSTDSEKLSKLAQYFDLVLDLPFDLALSKLKPEQFFEKILSTIEIKEVIVGEDVRFGYQAKGDARELKKLGKKFGFDCTFITRQSVDGVAVSSTYIRKLLENGNEKEAKKLLGSTL